MNEVTLNILRGAVTVTLFVLFVALIAYVFSPRRAKSFTEASNLIFDATDDSPPAADCAARQETLKQREETR